MEVDVQSYGLGPPECLTGRPERAGSGNAFALLMNPPLLFLSRDCGFRRRLP